MKFCKSQLLAFIQIKTPTFMLVLCVSVSCKSRDFGASHFNQSNPEKVNANEALPLRDASLLKMGKFLTISKNKLETFFQVSGAKVILADYNLLRRDFVHLKNLSNPEIENWLIDNTAGLSVGQVMAQKIRSSLKMPPQPDLIDKIPLTKKALFGFRPNTYHRAAVFTAKNPLGGVDLLLDAKGTGASEDHPPGFGSHRTGLLSLAEAIREFAMEKLLKEVSNVMKAKSVISPQDYYRLKEDFSFKSPLLLPISGDTVQTYAVIDLGLSMNHATESEPGSNQWTLEPNKKIPVGIVLRQAHVRRENDDFLEKRILIAASLRKFGMTLNDRSAHQKVEDLKFLFEMCRSKNAAAEAQKFAGDGELHVLTNVQTSEGGAVVDFGTLVVHENLRDPVCLSGVHEPLFWSKNTTAGWFLPNEIEPDTNLVPPLNDWKTFDEGNMFNDSLMRFGNEFAGNFQKLISEKQEAAWVALKAELRSKLKDRFLRLRDKWTKTTQVSSFEKGWWEEN